MRIKKKIGIISLILIVSIITFINFLISAYDIKAAEPTFIYKLNIGNGYGCSGTMQDPNHLDSDYYKASCLDDGDECSSAMNTTCFLYPGR
ncbi:MAG: hypothetical protein GYA62_02700 [Bacteroidales bacterium]|nr:hypothetical protein [Bacteroidales bacterium]